MTFIINLVMLLILIKIARAILPKKERVHDPYSIEGKAKNVLNAGLDILAYKIKVGDKYK